MEEDKKELDEEQIDQEEDDQEDSTGNQEELTPTQLKEQLEKEKTEKEKRKSRFKKTAAKLNDKGNDEDIDAVVEKKIQEREILSKVSHIASQIPEQYREVFDAEFKELTEGKTITPDNVEKYIKSALAVSIPDDQELYAVKATAIGSGGGVPKGSKEKKASKDVEYSNKLLKEQGIL